MPRKKSPPKNRFCRRSQFDEEEFSILVKFYFHEVLFGDSRNNYCFLFKAWHQINRRWPWRRKSKKFSYERSQLVDFLLIPSAFIVEDNIFKNKTERKEGKNEYITRQRISRLFNRIGQYIWDNYVITQHPAFQEEDVFDGLLDLIYGNTEELSTPYELVYRVLCFVGLPITEGDITSTLMFYWLSNRSKVVRGFKKDTFYLEFSRVLFICIVMRDQKIKYSSIYSIKEDLKLMEILIESTGSLLTILEEKPL